jgi:S-DNA-T family DNA segregation ATPase FtsK/SpoIIIE
MARRKTNSRDKPRRKLRWDWLFYALLVVAAFVAVWLTWLTIVSWVKNTTSNIWDIFGWGLIIVALAILTLVWLIWRRKVTSLFRQWHRWLAIVVLAIAAWGIIGLRDLGGNIGWGIIGYPEHSYSIGALRILGLFILSAILIAPGAFFRSLSALISWVWKQFRRRAVPKPAPREKPSPPPATVTPKSREKVPEVKPAAVAPTTVRLPAQLQKTLREVAQDVWKKYGESSTVVVDGWRLPPIDILDKSTEVEFSQADNVERARLIEEALNSYGVEAKVVQINSGPTVTQFGVEPGWDRKTKEIKERDRDGTIKRRKEEVSKTRVKVERITSLANDLALALASPSIRIEAPVPGQSVVGIEVPNVVSSVVSLRGVIETSAFQKMLAKSKLSIALGKGAGGEAGAADLDKMPHLLIAGATGSGKTVCLNTIICCLLLHNTPNDVRLIMIDPKRVELTLFNSIPHLAVPVIVNTEKALEALRWLNHEMDKRYQDLARAGARNIEIYNKNREGKEKMPYLVLIIDELADLMMAGFDEVEHILCRLAQLARATGIHLVVATQRPSVDVVTGLIKANFPTRISFAVTSQVDSRTILDSGGAEKLLGRGDMLYMPTEAAKPKRLQGCFVSDTEIERLVYFWASQRQEEVTPLKIEEPLQAPLIPGKRDSTRDPLLEAAKQLAKEHENVSVSFLQRRLQIGYPRAARIKEQLDIELAKEDETPEEENY